jgi:uncharacterized protein YjbI with pentapeptide repeats
MNESKNTSFKEQDLRFKSFKNSKFNGADFSFANLQGANFTNSELVNTSFYNADLRGCNFSESILKKVCFDGAKIGKSSDLKINLVLKAIMYSFVIIFSVITTSSTAGVSFDTSNNTEKISVMLITLFTSISINLLLFIFSCFSNTQHEELYLLGFSVSSILVFLLNVYFFREFLKTLSLSSNTSFYKADLSLSIFEMSIIEGANLEGANFPAVEIVDENTLN